MKANKNIVLLVCAALCVFVLTACAAQSGPVGGYSDLSSYPEADMTGYDCAQDYDKEYQFANMTVAEVVAEMDAGASFMLYCGYNHCPWCNVILNHINDIALQRGITVAYIDTRADPSWQSNLDITDYDLFAQRFGSVLDTDENGIAHLYVPHIFFIKGGQLVADHPGTVASQESPSDALDDAQIQEFKGIVNDSLNAIAS